MTTKAQLLTIADWDAMPYGDGNRYEIIEGELFVSCSPGLTHQTVLANLITLFVIFLQKNPVGRFLPMPGLILSEHSGVIPDLVIFLHEQSDEILKDGRLTGAPALVIEIVSPGAANIRRDRVTKGELYSKHGVPEYWIVDPENLTVDQYVSQGGSLKLIQTLHRKDILSSSAIPDFSCLVSDIFIRI